MNKIFVGLLFCILGSNVALAARTALPVPLTTIRTGGVIAVGSDNKTRVAWILSVPNVSEDYPPIPASDYTPNMIRVDTYDSAGNLLVQGPNYGPFGGAAGWSAPMIAVGPNNDVHLGWINNSVSQLSYWYFDNNNNQTQYSIYSTAASLLGGTPQLFGFVIDSNDIGYFAQQNPNGGSQADTVITLTAGYVINGTNNDSGARAYTLSANNGQHEIDVIRNDFPGTTPGTTLFSSGTAITMPGGWGISQQIAPISGWSPTWLTGTPDGNVQIWWLNTTTGTQQISVWDIPSVGFNNESPAIFSAGWVAVSAAACPFGGDGYVRFLSNNASSGQWTLNTINRSGFGFVNASTLTNF